MSEERFVDLESRLAHQDELLNQLNDAVTAQQATIMQLESLCKSLLERMRAMTDAPPTSDPGDEQPPHY